MTGDSVFLKDMRFYHPVNVRAAAEHQIALNKSPGLPVLSGQILDYFRILFNQMKISTFSISFHILFSESENRCILSLLSSYDKIPFILSGWMCFTSPTLRSLSPDDLIYWFIDLFAHEHVRNPFMGMSVLPPEPQLQPCFSCYFHFYDMRE